MKMVMAVMVVMMKSMVMVVRAMMMVMTVSIFSGLASGLGEGNGTPLQYSCLENPMDTGVWRVPVHRVAKSQTRLSN